MKTYLMIMLGRISLDSWLSKLRIGIWRDYERRGNHRLIAGGKAEVDFNQGKC